MSKSICLIPIAGCLNVAEKVIGPNREWVTVNETQKEFLDVFSRIRDQVSNLPELESIASYDVTVINKFLAENGFSIQLSPFEPPAFGVASLINILIEWIEKGEEVKIKDYPAVDIKKAEFYMHPDLPNPIVHLSTKGGEEVRMTMLENPPEGFALLELLKRTNSAIQCFDYKGVIFPMIEYDQEIDISWIIDMQTMGDDGKPAIIKKALQQTKFRMNEVGAIVQSAVAMTVARCCMAMPKPRHIIDKPFLLWIYRRETMGDDPIFVGYFTEEDWKKPKEL